MTVETADHVHLLSDTRDIFPRYRELESFKQLN